MNIRPLYDHVVVKPAEEEKKSAGGIVIPDSASSEKPVQGELIAVGNGSILNNGDLRPLTVKVGDKVLFGKYSGTEVKIEGQKYMVMKESDILGVIE